MIKELSEWNITALARSLFNKTPPHDHPDIYTNIRLQLLTNRNSIKDSKKDLK